MVRSWSPERILKIWVGVAGLVIVWLGACSTAPAADPSFVGVLALAVDKDAADRLGLSEEVRGRLRQLINEREDAALEIVLSIKDLPPMEQTARLTPFVTESERLGFALLTVPQREKLQQMRLAREGMSGLAEPGLAEALGLASDQKTAVEKLLTQRAADMTKGGESERRITRAVYERKLAEILNESQRANWEKWRDCPTLQPARSPTPPSPRRRRPRRPPRNCLPAKRVAGKHADYAREPAGESAAKARPPERHGGSRRQAGDGAARLRLRPPPRPANLRPKLNRRP